MPLPAYGVLIGTVASFSRDDPNQFGSYYHGKLRVNAPGGQYECAIDVSAPNNVKVQYRIVPNLDKRLFANILALSNGWHLLAQTPTSGALDYLRSTLLHPRAGCLTLLPSPLVTFLVNLLNLLSEQWTESTGDNALDQLDGLIRVGAKVYVFGAPFTSGLGVHDIHYNQGDPPGPYQHLDAIWQDGATIVTQADNSLVAFLNKFSTQSLKTDDNGLPL